ncbi:uncharacterized protein LOC131876739 [Cryptomeria japonica]|uniref:uncharacterized protein LOC131876739 n=1 Tax=Cryptomeria japonica TaxID=3369 RepID=UPI0027DA4ED7|nr:uncharacterized protein LOC131876739 [Cryptomeria japonica]
MEEGGPSKEESTQSKRSKNATGLKIQEDKDNQKETENDSEDIRKDGSEMETDEFGGEESWKEEDVGEEEEGAEDVSDQDNPTHSEKNKEFEHEMGKENLSKDKEEVGEGLILDNLKNLSKVRMGFDRWAYEGIKNLEKNGKRWEEKRKKDDRDQK